MRILNLYAGVGGNRENWGNSHEITAVEIDPKRAEKYKNKFPNDNVIIADAHEYLLDHYKEFDFIWSSPPCQTHSRANYFINNGVAKRPRYPSLELYEEIIFLQNFYKGMYCVENVISYYEPLIKPAKIGRHYIWSNFKIPKIKLPKNDIGSMAKGWNTACSIHIDERNKCSPELGEHILDCALGISKQREQVLGTLF